MVQKDSKEQGNNTLRLQNSLLTDYASGRYVKSSVQGPKTVITED
jgi:hypothetical protein